MQIQIYCRPQIPRLRTIGDKLETYSHPLLPIRVPRYPRADPVSLSPHQGLYEWPDGGIQAVSDNCGLLQYSGFLPDDDAPVLPHGPRGNLSRNARNTTSTSSCPSSYWYCSVSSST